MRMKVVTEQEVHFGRRELVKHWRADVPGRWVLGPDPTNLDGWTERIRRPSLLDYPCRTCKADVNQPCRSGVEKWARAHAPRIDKWIAARNSQLLTCPACSTFTTHTDEVPFQGTNWHRSVLHQNVRVYDCCVRWVLTLPIHGRQWELTLIEVPKSEE
ncbi:hypothetical protein GCM10027200_77390 [Lentzea nigeriaca]